MSEQKLKIQVLEQETQQFSSPDMGSHLLVDFHNIENFDLQNPEIMISHLKQGLQGTDCTLCSESAVIHDKNLGYSLLFLLSESHLSVHTLPNEKAFSIDFYNCGKNSWSNLKLMEEYLCSVFGWENASSSILLPRGRGQRLIDLQKEQETVITPVKSEKEGLQKQFERELSFIKKNQIMMIDTGIS